MSERDQRRQLAVGAGTSPADPGGHRKASPANGDVDVVRAVAALVNDLVDSSDDETPPESPAGEQQDLADGPEGTSGDAVAPWPDRGGTAVGPAR